VDDGCGVEIFECFCELVHNEPDVDILEYAFGDDVVEVGFHELEQ